MYVVKICRMVNPLEFNTVETALNSYYFTTSASIL